jgi:hypothetical protein
MEPIEHMLALPVQTLSVLAAGYMSYRLAYTGKDAEHKATDIIFMVFVFAFVAKLSGDLVRILGDKLDLVAILRDTVAILIGVVTALVTSAVWRKHGERWVCKILSKSKISHSDRTQTAWQAMVAKEHLDLNSLVVHKKDGSMVMSERLHDFNDLPFGSCILGPDGSIALYVTHKWHNTETGWEERDPYESGNFGAEVTYIPASEISEVSICAR